MYACLHAPDFAAQAALRSPLHSDLEMRKDAVAILDGDAPLEAVYAINRLARSAGVSRGMSRLQAESFPHLHLLRRSYRMEAEAQTALLSCASTFSPRIEAVTTEHRTEAGGTEAGGTVVLDIRGTSGLFGTTRQLATAALEKTEAAGMQIRVAISANFHTAICAARGLPGIAILAPGREAERLGPLPLSVLGLSPELAHTFHLWGIYTCAALAALPERDLIARLGQRGQQGWLLARGEHPHLLVPQESGLESELIETIELDHPVEQIEPLLFLFARLIDQLIARARSHSLALAAIHIDLTLDAKNDGNPLKHIRTIRPAIPSRDRRALLKLLQLELETRQPEAAVLVIRMSAEAARPQVAQQGLFLPQAPEAGELEILLARLGKLFGAERVGTPQLVDTHRHEAFRIATFTPPTPEDTSRVQNQNSILRQTTPAVLRVCRPPLAITVTLRSLQPTVVVVDGQHYSVTSHAGPWRISGQWWSEDHWCREEWDVVLADTRTSMIGRIAHDPSSNCWYLQGIYD